MAQQKTKADSWIGIDLDGTLAYYDAFSHEIGEPIPAMILKVKDLIETSRHQVKIFTARVCKDDPGVVRKIEDWCLEHIGVVLPITNRKDYMMIELWDDRCKQVIHNKGKFIVDE